MKEIRGSTSTNTSGLYDVDAYNLNAIDATNLASFKLLVSEIPTLNIMINITVPLLQSIQM
jgi:hypothetical protein